MLTDAIGMLTESTGPASRSADDVEVDGATARVVPRRRARLRVENDGSDTTDLRSRADFVANPHRFAGLEDRWFWNDRFQLEKRKGWAEQHAAEVAARRRHGLTEAALAAEFGKTIPTIRAALRFAAQDDASLAQLPRKMPRSRWYEDHALEVVSLKASSGMGTNKLADHFGKSDTTIRKAIAHAATLMASDSATPEDRMSA